MTTDSSPPAEPSPVGGWPAEPAGYTATTYAGRVPLGQKIAFGVGMLGNQLFPAALGVFMVVLVQSLKMDPVLAGVLAFLPRIFDGITDPVMGYITDNTKSRWGRRRPYVLLGAIIAGVSFAFMWQLDPSNSEMYNFWYFLLLALLFYLGMTIFATPYVAMGYEMSADFHERTRIMAVAQWIGQWAWVIAPWFWVVIYNPDLFPDGVSGARTLAVYVGIGCILLAITPAIFCRTHRVDPATQETLSIAGIGASIGSLVRSIGTTLSCGPFVRICLATFLIFGSFNTIAAFSFYIIVHYMYGGSTDEAGTWPTWFGTASALTTTFIAIPVVTLMSQRMGKRAAFVISQSISLLGYVAFWWCYQPGHPWLLFLPMPFFSFGIGGLFTIMMSMTADVCDLDELDTGSRREGLFGAVYWWMVKLGFAIAGLATGVIMSGAGFDVDATTQPPEALTWLRLAYTGVPFVGTVLAILIMLGYNLDEERSHDIRRQLDERKASEATDQAMAG
ncbi:MAG: MFS transporter [Planctomycetota bacterium]